MRKNLFLTTIAAVAIVALTTTSVMAEETDKIVVGVSTDTATTVFR